ncbi:glycosyltransferase [Citrobacter amalonaticus]|uniref:glycosyltransferase n=1 Tax=Citrobacter amalonaticus TaxID=35703 RepID=UPI000C12A9CB|nr:glycosyltransferase [Citrobacter amalonaticus]EGT4253155.1 glycosyltransferase [Citrobacter amalonaticus]MBJ9864703.1 glycosyltransferase [Citrobacter amalonaticus]
MSNIAFIVTKSEIGGAQTWTNDMMKLVRNGNNVHLITSGNGWLTEQSNYDACFILPELKKKFSLLGYMALLKYLKKEKINVMVASSANAGIFSRMCKLFHRFKCVYVSHGWSCIYNGGAFKPVFINIEKYLSYLTDTIWCVSYSDEINAKEKIGIKSKKIKTVHNSVSGIPKKENLENKKRVIFVGRLTHPKRPELLARVISKNPDIFLDIAGGGEYLTKLKEEFKGCNNINFLGEVYSFNQYHNYDIFALISDSEGLPMSALEAHTAGIPLLMSDVGGCKELINGNGLLVSNDEKDIEIKLHKIINEYDCYFSQAQSEKDKFEFDNYIERYKKLILS